MTKKITIEDIASRCGVSKATVSYVLNGKKTPMKISGNTVREILTTCRELGYRPDKTAQALAYLRKTPLDLIILTPWLYSQYSDFMAQINAAFEGISREKAIKFSYAYYRRGSLSDLLTSNKFDRYDAVVIAGTSSADDRYLAENKDSLANVILLNRYVDGVCSVYGNDREVTSQLAQSVKDKNYYDSFVNIREASDSLCRIERNTALDTVFGTSRYTKVSFNGTMDAATALELYNTYKKGKTCFAFTTFSPASLFLIHLIRAGVKVPEECGIICFDIHTLISDYLPLQLTTVDPRLSEMVHAAYETALAIKRGERGESVMVRGDVIPGETVI